MELKHLLKFHFSTSILYFVFTLYIGLYDLPENEMPKLNHRFGLWNTYSERFSAWHFDAIMVLVHNNSDNLNLDPLFEDQNQAGNEIDREVWKVIESVYHNNPLPVSRDEAVYQFYCQCMLQLLIQYRDLLSDLEGELAKWYEEISPTIDQFIDVLESQDYIDNAYIRENVQRLGKSWQSRVETLVKKYAE